MARGVEWGLSVAAATGVFVVRKWLASERARLEAGETSGLVCAVLGVGAAGVGGSLLRRWARERAHQKRREAAVVADVANGTAPEVCQCRICREEAPRDRFAVPCDCRGSLASPHFPSRPLPSAHPLRRPPQPGHSVACLRTRRSAYARKPVLKRVPLVPSQAFVHADCERQWQEVAGSNICSVCGARTYLPRSWQRVRPCPTRTTLLC